MSTYLYVDYSNLIAEAKHIAAVRSGLAQDLNHAQDNRISAPWHCHFRNLLSYTSGSVPARALLVTSEPFYGRTYAEHAGFEVKVYPRGYKQREKCVDTHLATQIVRDALTIIDSKTDEIVMVTGDLDQIPTIRLVKQHGHKVVLVFWEHAAMHLRSEADGFFALNPQWEHLTWRTATTCP